MIDLGLTERQEDRVIRRAKEAERVGQHATIYLQGILFDVEMVRLDGFDIDIPRMRRRDGVPFPVVTPLWFRLAQALCFAWRRK